MTAIQLLITIVSLFTIGILILKYIDGDFTYKDEIIHKGDLINSRDRVTGTFYTIQRTYNSGRIKIITQNCS